MSISKSPQHRPYQWLIIIVSLSLLSACSGYKYVTIETLASPDYQLAPNINRLLIINRTSQNTCNSMAITVQRNTTENYFSNNELDPDSVIAFELYNTYNHLYDSQAFYDITLEKKDAAYKRITSLFEAYNADAILALTSVSYNGKVDYLYEDENLGHMQINTRSQWCLYTPGSTMTPYSFTIKDTLYWNEYIPNRIDNIADAVWENGQLAAKHIAPYWTNEQRLYFYTPYSRYWKTNAYIQSGHWEEAAKIWMSYYNASKGHTKTSGKLAYNMALFFELRSDFKSALEWLTIAHNAFMTTKDQTLMDICTNYKSLLEERLLEQSDTNEQTLPE